MKSARCSKYSLADNTVCIKTQISVFNVQSKQPVGSPYAIPGDANTATFSLDGKILASMSGTNIQMWNVATGNPLPSPITGITSPVTSMAFRPGNQTLATGSQDGSVRLWDVMSGRLISDSFKDHTGMITGLAFSPDGTSLAASSRDKTVLIWDVTSKSLIETLNGDSQKTMIFLFTHARGSISKKTWALAHKLELLPNYAVRDTSLSIIQSSLTRLEAIARITPLKDGGNDLLVAYEFDQMLTWKGPLIVRANNGPIDQITGSQALIESDRDFFELLVPRGASIDHYVHNIETITDGDWALVARLPLPEGGTNAPAVSLAQGLSGGLVAIASVTAQSEGSDFLVGFQFDQEEWLGPVKLIADDGPISGVTGSQDIIVNNEGDIELLVPRGAFIYHYRHAGDTILEGNWQSIARLSQPKGNDKAQAISVSLTQNVLGQLELVARVRPPAGTGGDFFVAYEYSQQAGWSTPSVLVSDQGPITAGDISTPPDDDDKDGKYNGSKTRS